MKHYLTQKITYNGTEVIDIFKSFRFLEQFKQNVKFYYDYYIQDEETPELLSHKLYGTTDYWWVILIFNNMHDGFFDWVLNNYEIEEWAKKLVPDWETNPGDYASKIIELTTENDAKRKIKILRTEYIDVLIKQLRGF